jgi:prevent-host-death family protein
LVNVDQSGEIAVTRRIYNLYAAKTALSKLVDRAAAGEEIIIAKAGTPRAKLVPVRTSPRKPGGWEGRVRISKNFDAPLPKPLRDAFERDA